MTSVGLGLRDRFLATEVGYVMWRLTTNADCFRCAYKQVIAVRVRRSHCAARITYACLLGPG